MLFTKSESMQLLLSQINKVYQVSHPILIQGPEGTELDKELIAKKIHELSDRRDKPFVFINCAALKGIIMTSELFGHVKGSFPSAYTNKVGLLECANGGTIYFENIQELDLENQEKLSKFLENYKLSKIGSDTSKVLDIKIISSVQEDSISNKVNKDLFKEELYFKMNTINIYVPELSKRNLDILDMVNYHLKQSGWINSDYKITPEVQNFLLAYPWAGNTSELINMCEYVFAACDNNTVTLKDLPKYMTSNLRIDVTYSPNINLYDLEKSYILKALDYHKGNKTKAAAALGITIKTLYNKIADYGIK